MNQPASQSNFIKDEYLRACRDPSDINQHLPTLFHYAGCRGHVAEMGVRTGVSTRAFLAHKAAPVGEKSK